MMYWGYIINIVFIIFLFMGCTRIYFFVQKQMHGRSLILKKPLTYFDERIPFKPNWVWIYSGLFFPLTFALILIIESYQEFMFISLNFIFLIAWQIFFYYVLPIKTPSAWRCYSSEQSLSTKFLSFVQSFDGRGNCFPSMHVSFATLLSFHLANSFLPLASLWAYLFFLAPLLVAISTLYTKQHYLIDTLGGFLLGWFCFYLFGLGLSQIY